MKMSEDVLSYIGELCGSAWKDMSDADPADVGLYGVPIKQWRGAYYEGCKDMADGIVTRIPDADRPEAITTIKAAYDKAAHDTAADNPKTEAWLRNPETKTWLRAVCSSCGKQLGGCVPPDAHTVLCFECNERSTA